MTDRDTSPSLRRKQDILEQLRYCEQRVEAGLPYSHSEGIWREAADTIENLRHTGRTAIAEDALQIVEAEIGGIHVGRNGSCRWTDVANALVHIKAQLRAPSPAPIFECPDCGKDVADRHTEHAADCRRRPMVAEERTEAKS